jgi:hypothetical protein
MLFLLDFLLRWPSLCMGALVFLGLSSEELYFLYFIYCFVMMIFLIGIMYN